MIIDKAGGIDLGTTNSVVAVTNETDTDIICYENKKGKKTIPSVVALDTKDNKIIVGDGAFNRRGRLPEPVVSIKRKMGTTEKVMLGKKEMSPEEVSSLILAECKRLMEEKLNAGNSEDKCVMDRAVITVPAYFSINAIEATKKAGELAGLYVQEILTEPTAAAIFYAWKHGIQDGNFVVYDLGGGTFDVSIVQKIAGLPLVIGFAGNNYLGGDNFDREFARELINMLGESDPEYCLDLDVHNNPNDRVKFTKLVLEAECIKKELSKEDEVFWTKAGVIQDKEGLNVNIDMTFTREQFEEIIRKMVESTIPECEKALSEAEKNAGITIEDIDYILLVGGSTKIPLVRKMVKEKFCNQLYPHAKCEEPVHYEPDMAVGYGAAIRAACYGTKYFNNSKSFCVNIKTMGGSSSQKHSFSGTVEALDRRINLQGSRIKAANLEGTFSAEAPINNDGSFEIKDLPLKENTMTGFNFLIINGSGDVIIDFSTKVAHDEHGDFSDGPVSVAILPNTVNIEVYNKDRGQVEMRPLMEKGTQLPAKASYSFYTSVDDIKLLIKIFENYTLLKEIVIPFDQQVKAGTPIDFEMFVTENVIITAKGQVAGKGFEAVIERPEIPVPTQEYYEELKRKCDETISMLPPGDQVKYKMKKKNICMNIDEGFLENEKQRIIEYVDKLKELIVELEKIMIDSKSVLTPDKIEDLADEAFELLPKAKNAAKKKGKKCEVSEETIQKTREEGLAAVSINDKYKFDEAVQKLDSIIRYLSEIVIEDTPPPPPWMLAMYGCQYVAEQIEKLENESVLLPAHEAEINKIKSKVASFFPAINPAMNEAEAQNIFMSCRQFIVQINKIIQDINKVSDKPIPPIPTPNF